VSPLLFFSTLMMCGGTRLLNLLPSDPHERAQSSGLILLIKGYGHIPLILLNLWSPFDTCIYACVRTNIYSFDTAMLLQYQLCAVKMNSQILFQNIFILY